MNLKLKQSENSFQSKNRFEKIYAHGFNTSFFSYWLQTEFLIRTEFSVETFIDSLFFGFAKATFRIPTPHRFLTFILHIFEDSLSIDSDFVLSILQYLKEWAYWLVNLLSTILADIWPSTVYRLKTILMLTRWSNTAVLLKMYEIFLNCRLSHIIIIFTTIYLVLCNYGIVFRNILGSNDRRKK